MAANANLNRKKLLGRLLLFAVPGIVLFGVAAASVIIISDLRIFASISLLSLAFGIIIGEEIYPYRRPVRSEARPLVSETTNRFEEICKVLGLSLLGVWLASESTSPKLARVGGILPGNRHLFVDDALLEDFEKEAQLAVVALVAARAKRHFDIYRTAVPLLLVAIYILLEALGNYQSVPGSALLKSDWYVLEIGLVIGLLVTSAYGRRLVYAADRSAASATTPSTVADALEEIAGGDGEGAMDRGRIKTWIAMEPSVRERVERIRSEFDSEQYLG